MRWISRDERPLHIVPTGTIFMLSFAAAAQFWVGSQIPKPSRSGAELPDPPNAASMRLASLDERAIASRALMIHLQSIDLSSTNDTPYRLLDYRKLTRWLQTALELDKKSQYPLFLAAHIYTQVSDVSKVRVMLDFVYAKFLEDPPTRWQWLAHGALVAKHRLRDLSLARTYAAELTKLSRSVPGLPLWAQEMEGFVLEEMGELEAARIMLGGLLENGHITDPDEIRFLRLRIQKMESAPLPTKPR